MIDNSLFIKAINNETEALIELGKVYFSGSEGEENKEKAVVFFGKAVENALKKVKHSDTSDLEKVICFLQEQFLGTCKNSENTQNEEIENFASDDSTDIFSDSSGELRDSFWAKEESDEPEQINVEEVVEQAKSRYFGNDAEKDHQEARRLFALAAAKGNTEAKKYYAYMCMRGNGGESDYLKAEKLFKEVIDSRESEFYEETSICLAELYVTCLNDMPKAVEVWEKLAVNGNADAQYNYGLSLFKGIGTEQDMERGVFWWQNAAENGHEDAKHNLEVLFGNK